MADTIRDEVARAIEKAYWNYVVYQDVNEGSLSDQDAVTLADAAISAIEDRGYVLVPREPDQAMHDAVTAFCRLAETDEHQRDILGAMIIRGYRAMVATALGRDVTGNETSAAHKQCANGEALKGLELAIYAITSLCPEENDGSHRPIISKKTLTELRAYRERAIANGERVHQHALRLAEGRLAMLMRAELPESDHPGATQYVLDEVRKVLAASPPEPSRETDGWRPIETAPKDGTVIWLGSPDRVEVGLWVVMGKKAEWWSLEGLRTAANVSDIGLNVKVRSKLDFDPTHWQPTPLPPSPKSEALAEPAATDQPVTSPLNPEPTGKLEVRELRHYARRDWTGNMEIVDRQFDFVRAILPYNYAYTSNAQQHDEAQRICEALEGPMSALGIVRLPESRG